MRRFLQTPYLSIYLSIQSCTAGYMTEDTFCKCFWVAGEMSLKFLSVDKLHWVPLYSSESEDSIFPAECTTPMIITNTCIFKWVLLDLAVETPSVRSTSAWHVVYIPRYRITVVSVSVYYVGSCWKFLQVIIVRNNLHVVNQNVRI